MKQLLLLVSMICFAFIKLSAQEWITKLPQEKLKKSELSFFEIQNAFNAYCEENQIVDGKKSVNGELLKVSGWKQYKRWEWYWESRVNPVTGEFPDKGALDQLIKHQSKNTTSTKNGGEWQAMGPSSSYGGYSGLGRINCIAFHPSDNNTYWVGSPSGGLWKTTDDGANWEVLTDSNEVLGVSEIVIPSDYETSNTLYIATGDRDGGSMWSLGGGASSDNNSIGVLKSTNGGLSWEATGFTYSVSENKRIGRLVKHPDNDAVFIMGTSDGIYRSTDTMNTWSQVYSGTYVVDIEFKASSADTVYATNKDYWGDTEVLMSTNNGINWSSIYTFPSDAYRAQIAVTPANAEYLYVITSISNGGLDGIYKSTNGGDSFTQLVDGDDENKSYLYYFSDGSGDNDGQGGYDLCIAASPIDEDIAIIGGVNAWKTTDGGSNWNICNMWTSGGYYNPDNAPEVHADKHLQVFRADGTLFETNDGGVYKSTNNGVSWTDKTNNMTISQIYRLGVSQSNENVVVIGLQDNGSKMIYNESWYDVTGGDGMECIIDPDNADIQYATYVRGRIYRTNDMWGDYITISDNIENGTLTGAWVTPYILDKNDPATMYVGYEEVYKSENRGNSFTKISNLFLYEKIRSMAIAPSNSSYLYVADHSSLYKTSNGGDDWTNITNGLPVVNANITYIAVKEDDPETLWVTFGGYNGHSVYQSTNAGSSWINISAGLPEIPVMSIAQNIRAQETQLFIGTDVGVYTKTGDNNWEMFNTGLPNVVVTELEFFYDEDDYSNAILRAATYGRGLWESPVTIEGAAPVAEFSASSNDVLMDESVVYTDLSSNNPSTWEWEFEGGTPATSNDHNPEVLYSTPGTYNVSLKVSNAEGDNTILKEDYVTVSWRVPELAYSATPTEGAAPLIVQFTSATQYATTWAWDFGDGQTSDEENPQHAYDEGIYTVKLTASNPAESDSLVKENFITVNVNAIPEIWKNKLDVYPNPASELLNVDFKGIEGIKQIALLDLQGKTIFNETILNQESINFNVESLEANTYLLQIVSNQKIVVLKVIIK